MAENTAIDERTGSWRAPPPDPDTRRERHARYAAGQAIAAYHYQVPLEAIIVDMSADRGAVILWPVIYPTDGYLWGRVVVCLAGREAVEACAYTNPSPIDAIPNAVWDYVPPPTRSAVRTDDGQAWQIIQTLHVSLRARRNDLYGAARRQAYALFLNDANRAALHVLARNLSQRGEITGMEAAAIIRSVTARSSPQSSAPLNQAGVYDTWNSDTLGQAEAQGVPHAWE